MTSRALAVDIPPRSHKRNRPADPARIASTAEVRPGAVLRRSPRSCACEGNCPRCRDEANKDASSSGAIAIGPTDDSYEIDADRAAEAIIGAPVRTVDRPSLQRAPAATIPHASLVAPASVHAALDSPAIPLEADVRADMEDQFGHNFESVRVHSDGPAAESARDVDALAYTVGSHVVFAPGEYAPNSDDGRQLLAHELAHVVQQGAATSSVSASAHTSNLQRKKAPRSTAKATGDKTGASLAWDDSLRVMDVITELLEADGLQILSEDEKGKRHLGNFPAGAENVPERWQPLLQEWWRIIVGSWSEADGTVVSYPGDMRTTHIDAAVAATAPLVAELKAEGDASTGLWLAAHYTGPVQRLRVRAAGEAVSQVVDQTAKKAAGGALDLGAMNDIQQLQLFTADAIKTLRAVMTVSTRLASANLNQARELDKAYAAAMQSEEVTKSLATVRAEKLNTALGQIQGMLYMVQTILTISDPKKRYEKYKDEWARFGPVASSTYFLKDIGVALGGATAVFGAAGFAIAKVTGKAELAAKALSWGSRASTELGKVNIALNALGVIHGVVVLCDSDATAMEKTEAGVEATSGALGLAGRFIPSISPVTAALSGSLLINFYAFKGILEQSYGAYAGLMAWGLNICYADLKKTGGYISEQAMRYAAALDLADTFHDKIKAAELVSQTEGLRLNLVDFLIKPFMERATTSYGRGNADPGVYSVLRRRFLALGTPVLDTPEHVIAFTRLLLETIVSCFADAPEIYKQQVYETWANH
jgi:hypothetical protein